LLKVPHERIFIKHLYKDLIWTHRKVPALVRTYDLPRMLRAQAWLCEPGRKAAGFGPRALLGAVARQHFVQAIEQVLTMVEVPSSSESMADSSLRSWCIGTEEFTALFGLPAIS
jgi:hypothetical protein